MRLDCSCRKKLKGHGGVVVVQSGDRGVWVYPRDRRTSKRNRRKVGLARRSCDKNKVRGRGGCGMEDEHTNEIWAEEREFPQEETRGVGK